MVNESGVGTIVSSSNKLPPAEENNNKIVNATIHNTKFAHALLQSLSRSYRLLGTNNNNFKHSLGRELALSLNEEELVKHYKYHTSQFIQNFAIPSERVNPPENYNPTLWFFNPHCKSYVQRRCKKFKYAFQLWQAKRGVDSPLPDTLKEADYKKFKERLTQVVHTPQNILDELSSMSREFFKEFKQPTLTFHTTTKACFEGPSHMKYIQEKYQIPEMPRYKNLHQLCHQNLAKKYPIPLEFQTQGRSKQLDEPMKIRTITAMSHECFLFKRIQEELLSYINKKLDNFSLTKNGGDIIKSTKYLIDQPGLFVSGDFDAATDNLHRDVVHAVVDQIPIYQSIKNQFSTILIDDFHTNNGQLMGSILSFPILCVINYLVHKYCLKQMNNIPIIETNQLHNPNNIILPSHVLDQKNIKINPYSSEPTINGDDILFRSSQEFLTLWLSTTTLCGLIPSKGKNLVSNKYFTINSRPFVLHNDQIIPLSFANLKLTQATLRDKDPILTSTTNIKKFFFGLHQRELQDEHDLKSVLPYFRDFGKHVAFKIWKKFKSDYLPVCIGGTGLFPTDPTKATPLQTLYSYNRLKHQKIDIETPLQKELKVRTFLIKTDEETSPRYNKIIKHELFKLQNTFHKKDIALDYLLKNNNDLVLKYLSNQNTINNEAGWAFSPLKKKVSNTAGSKLVNNIFSNTSWSKPMNKIEIVTNDSTEQVSKIRSSEN